MFHVIVKESPLNCTYKGQRHESLDAVLHVSQHLLPNHIAYVPIILLVHINNILMGFPAAMTKQ
jgi:hypothetical protein